MTSKDSIFLERGPQSGSANALSSLPKRPSGPSRGTHDLRRHGLPDRFPSSAEAVHDRRVHGSGRVSQDWGSSFSASIRMSWEGRMLWGILHYGAPKKQPCRERRVRFATTTLESFGPRIRLKRMAEDRIGRSALPRACRHQALLVAVRRIALDIAPRRFVQQPTAQSDRNIAGITRPSASTGLVAPNA